MADVARLAGVSVATASRTLSRARRVTPDLQAQVVSAAQALGYTPGAHARALAQSLDTSVGVVVHDLTDPYFAEIVGGILEVAGEAERLVLVASTYRDPRRELACIAHFRAQRVQALVLVGSGREDREFGRALASQIEGYESAGGRAALIGRHRAPADSVLSDNFGGGRALAVHLAGLGHRQVGVITGPKSLTTVSDRLAGFRQGLLDHGVELAENALEPSDFTRTGGERATDALLDRLPDLTAIFSFSDSMGIGALAAIRRRGLRIPEDISLAGFDDIAISRDLMPALTTVRVPMREMGASALRMAIGPRHGDDFRVQQVPLQLIVRYSTGVAKNRQVV
ncbi:MAG TPA: LacI family DNA-binding transcriptional regulator [Candidatus Dormibacteraeota bacterium]|nr:LacI family DNA-binding transcriptional regulator [Candidatus Dormibacteraeota bacterium]